MGLDFGEAAPWFEGITPTNPRYVFSGAAGRFVLLGFLPDDAGQRAQALERFRRCRAQFDDVRATAYMVVRDPAAIAEAQNEVPGLRWFLDANGRISRLYDALGEDGVERSGWLLLDPNLRVLAKAGLEDDEALFRLVLALPAPDDHAGAPLHAPVLIVPRVFEPDLCRQLIAYYEAQGGTPSGVMRQIDGRTVAVLDDFKRRRDADIADEALRRALQVRIARRLLPEVKKTYQFKATRMERYIVACYDAEDGGYFRPHRDNTTAGTAHRRFAISINLNADAFEGGDLRFPEFGRRTYRPPTGGAVVFSCSLLHEATPVTRGRRYAFLPFLYDEADAAVREANLKFLNTQPTAAPEASASSPPQD
jgi:predicted 2-oxoglutarate/Fe(II)-dependent dioxygenase YbiX/peroxiredoxin